MLWLLTLFLFLLQSLLTPLLAPYPPPDLLLIAALFWLGRFGLPRALLLAYGLGLLQDLAGSGTIGLHALGLAAGVFCGSWAAHRDGFLQGSLPSQLVTVGFALFGKWLAFALLLLYLGQGQPLGSTLQAASLELLFTLLVTALLHPLLSAISRRRERTFYL